MTGKTDSERLFEQFCKNAAIDCRPVPREKNERTPDYELTFCELMVVAEVKQIERNKEEKESDRQLVLRGYGNATGGMPGQRVRKKIDSCSPQIKARTQGTYPGLLVLYERHFAASNIDPYNILVAMYGLQTVDLTTPQTGSPYVVSERFGPERRMTQTDNTTISAIATLHPRHLCETQLSIYHNKFAAIPLPPEILAPYPIRQLRLADALPGTFPCWEIIAQLP